MRMERALLLAVVAAALSGSCAVSVVDGGSGGTSATNAGLPCGIYEFLQTRCANCHSIANPPGGVRLDTYADLAAESPMFPGQTVAERALARIEDAAKPMPPPGGLAADEVKAFADWVNAGAAKGDCTEMVPPPMPICTSNAFAGMSCESDAQMNPGTACIGCHTQPVVPPCEGDGEPGPALGFAGTVYPTFHELDLCLATGVAGAQVIVVDANDQQHTATVLPNGNFSVDEAAPLPFKKVGVIANGKEVDMLEPGPPVDGDCNRCHTVDGSQGAPGRIVPPQ